MWFYHLSLSYASSFLLLPCLHSVTSSSSGLSPPVGSLQVALPDAHVHRVLLAGETGASQASCHGGAT